MSGKSEKTRYSDEELEEFKALINKKLEKAKHELDFFSREISARADNSDTKVKGLEDGNSTAESEHMSALAARHEKYIQHLENALIRIDNKVYGICRETGKLISKNRLLAVPHATLSIEAKTGR